MSVASDSGTADGNEGLSGSPEPLPRDKIFHILQTQRRRDALRYLKEQGGAVEMRDLAEQVAAWENDITVRELSSEERQRVYIALYQSHLPKLDQEDIIEYDQSRGTVERGSLAEQFDPYLDATADDADDDEGTATPWLAYYRATTVASTVVVGSSWLGLPPVSMLPGEAWGTLVVTAFTLLSLAQVLAGR